jgi:hypothetical protein
MNASRSDTFTGCAQMLGVLEEKNETILSYSDRWYFSLLSFAIRASRRRAL